MKIPRSVSLVLYLAALTATLVGTGSVATAAPAHGDLYAATGSGGIDGSLYTLDPSTGAVIANFGELHDLPGGKFGLTGLAFHPTTSVLYGSTAARSATAPNSLVSVDPVTAEVTVIGAYGITGTLADLTFNPITGILYGWQSGGNHQLHTVNLITGAATPVPGAPATSDAGGGGLAMNALALLYVTPDGQSAANPTIQQLDPSDGSSISGNTLTPGFVGTSTINAMAFDPFGTLFGVNTDRGGPALTHLVTINPATGFMTDVGPSVDNLDAIAFYIAAVPEAGTTGALAACAVGMGLVWRRSRRKS